MSRTALVCALVLGVVLAACASEQRTDETAKELVPRVAEARELAEGGDMEAAVGKLDEIRLIAIAHRDDGDLGDERAAAILAAADRVELSLTGEEPAPVEPAGTSTTTAPAPVADDRGPDPDHPDKDHDEDEEKDEEKEKDDKGKEDDD